MEERHNKRYIVISHQTQHGPEYRIYDQVLGCTLEGGFDTEKWAESVAGMMEEKWRNEKHKRNTENKGDVTEGTR